MKFAETSVRRMRLFWFLVFLAVTGALLAGFSDPGSRAAEAGWVLTLMWVPVVGKFVFYFAQKRAPFVKVPPDFGPAGGLVPHISAEIALLDVKDGGREPIPPGEYRCVFVVGTEGFSVRFIVPAAAPLAAGSPQRLAVEFLVPKAALPDFPGGTEFKVLEGKRFVGNGKVIERVGENERLLEGKA